MPIVRKLSLPTLIEKTAARQLLGDNPQSWSSDLMAQLFRQHPFLSDYKVDVQVLNEDQAAGYLHGVFTVSPPAPVDAAYPEKPAYVRIPVIVQERKAYPFDVFIDTEGKFYPLTQTRLSTALFQASPYQAVNKPRGVMSQQSGSMIPEAPDTANPRYQFDKQS
ncbi:MAG: hypothetical protein ACOYOB_18965, partial [Myxococcota bacterium]